MANAKRQLGFSLIEVLMAVGILTVGLIIVAGVFPVGIHLTAVAAERTVGAVVADEAFAKVQLYGKNPNYDITQSALLVSNACEDFNNLLPAGQIIDSNEFLYPSDTGSSNQKYSWDAICRKVSDKSVQVTIFVCRKVANGLNYYKDISTGGGERPVPIKMEGYATFAQGYKKVDLSGLPGSLKTNDCVTDNSVIVMNNDGEIYRVIEVGEDSFWLDKKWEKPSAIYDFWIVPPPVDGGRCPCVGVYQRIINF